MGIRVVIAILLLAGCGSGAAPSGAGGAGGSAMTGGGGGGGGAGHHQGGGGAGGAGGAGGSCGGSGDLLDPMRAIDWTQSGVSGGVPARATLCKTLDASAFGDGVMDATSAIQSALDGCASDHTVALSAGTFLIGGSVTIPAHVTLRGAGAGKTTLNGKGSELGVVQLGKGSPLAPDAVDITGGATKGSTSLTLSKASGISVGDLLVVSELNDPSFVSIHGGEGDCTWCDTFWQGTRARGQIVEVTKVDGKTVGVAPGLYSAYPRSPQAVPFSPTHGAGVEDLQVYANDSGYTASFHLSACSGCWVKGVESNYTDGDFVQVHWGFRDEIRDSYFSNAYGHSPGTTDSDVFIADKTSATRVENNIVERGHVSIMLNWGAAGNVIAYNYTFGEFDENATNVVIGGIGMHGAHPQFNLAEGNVTTLFSPDEIWGSNSHNTAFRNWTTGTARVCTPLSGRGTVTCTGDDGHDTFQGSRAMQIANQSTSYSFVGNVVGSEEQSNLLAYGTNPVQVVKLLKYPAARIYDSTVYNWTFGYGEESDDGSGDGCAGGTMPPCHGTKAFDTAFFHGNYSHADGSIDWAPKLTHDLPCSMYLSGKPSWWKGMPFPAIGPDIHGGPGPGGHAYGNPAQACYAKIGGMPGGPNSPVVFDAKGCYGG